MRLNDIIILFFNTSLVTVAVGRYALHVLWQRLRLAPLVVHLVEVVLLVLIGLIRFIVSHVIDTSHSLVQL